MATGLAAACLALGPNGEVGRVWAPSRADMAGCGSRHQLLSQALTKMPPLRLCPIHCGIPLFLCLLAICLSHYTSSSRMAGTLAPCYTTSHGALLTTSNVGKRSGFQAVVCPLYNAMTEKTRAPWHSLASAQDEGCSPDGGALLLPYPGPRAALGRALGAEPRAVACPLSICAHCAHL